MCAVAEGELLGLKAAAQGDAFSRFQVKRGTQMTHEFFGGMFSHFSSPKCVIVNCREKDYNNKSMKTLVAVIIISLTFVACAPAPTGSTLTPTVRTGAAATLVVSPPAVTGIPIQVAESATPAYVEFTSGSLWVRLFAPQDDEIVSMPEVDVSGQAPGDTVISINDTIFIVPPNQFFTMPMALEEGPNVLEFVASDINGNEVSFVLTIVYEP